MKSKLAILMAVIMVAASLCTGCGSTTDDGADNGAAVEETTAAAQ